MLQLLFVLLSASAFLDASAHPTHSPQGRTACLDPDFLLDRVDSEPVVAGLDLIGPDGLVYPDWRTAGYFGSLRGSPSSAFASGIGSTTVAFPAGVASRVFSVANVAGPDTANILQALEQARNYSATTAGGWGIVELSAGEYELDEPLSIMGERILLRGAGRTQTTIRFSFYLSRYETRIQPPRDGVLWQWHSVTALIYPFGLRHVDFVIGGGAPLVLLDTDLAHENNPANWCILGVGSCEPPRGNQQYAFQLGLAGSAWSRISAFAGGSVNIVVNARWYDGTTRSDTITVRVEGRFLDSIYGLAGRVVLPSYGAAITIAGDGWTTCCQDKMSVLAPFPRGTTELIVTPQNPLRPLNPASFFVGKTAGLECSMISTDTRWFNVTGEGNVRRHMFFTITATRNATGAERTRGQVPVTASYSYVLTLDRPLEFPIFDRTERWMSNCLIDTEFWGARDIVVRDFRLEFDMNPEGPAQQLLVDGISLNLAEEVLLDEIDVIHAGDWPLRISRSRRVEATNMWYDSSFYPHVGSRGYVGGCGLSHELLFYNIKGNQLRHIDIQSAASYVAMCRARFEDADPQSHQGHSRDCTFDASYFTTTPGALWYNGGPNVTWNAVSGPYWVGFITEIGTFGGHTPGGGPRWVIYGSDARGGAGGLTFGGQNERHLVIGNRLWQDSSWDNPFVARPVSRVYEQAVACTIHNNVFRQHSRSTTVLSMLHMMDGGAQNCGNELSNNVFYDDGYVSANGNYTGPKPLTNNMNAFDSALSTGNTFKPYDESPALPVLNWPSMVEWQRGLPGVSFLTPQEGPAAVASRNRPVLVKVRANAAGGEYVSHVEIFADSYLAATLRVSAPVAQSVPQNGVVDLEGQILVESFGDASAIRSSGNWSKTYLLRARVFDTAGRASWAVFPQRITVVDDAIHMYLPATALPSLSWWWRADQKHFNLGPIAAGVAPVLGWRERWTPVATSGDRSVTASQYPTNNAAPQWVQVSPLNSRPAVLFARRPDSLVDALRTASGQNVPWSSFVGKPQTLFIVAQFRNAQVSHELWGNTNYMVQVGQYSLNGNLGVVRLRNLAQNVVSNADVVAVNTTLVLCRTSSMNGVEVYSTSDGTPVLQASRSEYVDALFDGPAVIGGEVAGRDLDGYISEVLLFRTQLSSTARQQVHEYLESYYGVNGKPELTPLGPESTLPLPNPPTTVTVIHPSGWTPSTTGTTATATSTSTSEVSTVSGASALFPSACVAFVVTAIV